MPIRKHPKLELGDSINRAGVLTDASQQAELGSAEVSRVPLIASAAFDYPLRRISNPPSFIDLCDDGRKGV